MHMVEVYCSLRNFLSALHITCILQSWITSECAIYFRVSQLELALGDVRAITRRVGVICDLTGLFTWFGEIAAVRLHGKFLHRTSLQRAPYVWVSHFELVLGDVGAMWFRQIYLHGLEISMLFDFRDNAKKFNILRLCFFLNCGFFSGSDCDEWKNW